MQTLRERSKQRRREQILGAAHALVAAHGIGGLTMRALSERAGLSVPTIYHLIGGRDAVVAMLLTEGGARFEELMLAAPAAPMARALEAVETLVALATGNRAIVRSVLAAGGHPMVAGRDDTLLGRARLAVEAAFAEAARASTIRRSVDPATMAERFDALVSGAIVAWATSHGDDERLRLDLRHGVLLLFDAAATDQARAAVERELRGCERALARRPVLPAAAGAPDGLVAARLAAAR